MATANASDASVPATLFSFNKRLTIMGATVNILKKTTYEMRPDGSSSNSFPSGHTATAFMGAEFLYQEYKNTSIWYGVTGYAIATGTGFFRMYNDRHWLNDIAAGAGIGILSTKIAYWLHPHIKTLLFKNEKKLTGTALPYFFVKIDRPICIHWRLAIIKEIISQSS